MIARAFVLAVVAVGLSARLADAHQSSVKYVDIAIRDDRVDVQLKVAPGDVAEAMGLAPDAKPAAAEAAAAPRVPAYVQRWLVVASEAGACTAEPARAIVDADNFVNVVWSAQCAREIRRVALDFTAFFAVDKRMEAIVRFAARDSGNTQPVVVRASEPIVRVHVSQPARSGIELLLLVIALGLGLLANAVFDTALALVVLAIGFGLGLGLSGSLELPDRLVGVLAAAAVSYTAAERAMSGERWRTVAMVATGSAVVFVFGIVQGLYVRAVPLAGLGIGAIALSILFGIAGLLRARASETWRRRITLAIGATVFVAGTVLVACRGFDM